jgi:hypothetical protein
LGARVADVPRASIVPHTIQRDAVLMISSGPCSSPGPRPSGGVLREVFLKTIIPSRKATKRHLKAEGPNDG